MLEAEGRLLIYLFYILIQFLIFVDFAQCLRVYFRCSFEGLDIGLEVLDVIKE